MALPFFKTKRLRALLIATLLLLPAVWLGKVSLTQYLFHRGVEAKRDWRLTEAVNNLDWALRLGSGNRQVRLERALANQRRGHFTESQSDLDQLLADGALDSQLRVLALNAAGINHFNFVLPDRAVALHEESLQLARQQGLQKSEGEALIHLSRVLYHAKGQYEAAVGNLEKALALGKQLNDAALQADALRNLGVIFWWFKAEVDRPMVEFYLPALELYRSSKDRGGEATTLSNICLIYSSKGDVFEALKYQNESIEIRNQIGDKGGLADSYLAMGAIFAGIENHRKARSYFQEGLKLAQQAGYRLAQNEIEVFLAGTYVNLDELDHAIPLMQGVTERERANPVLARYRYGTLANCFRLRGEHDLALRNFQIALEINRAIATPDPRFSSAMKIYMADSLMARGQWREAGELLRPIRESRIPLRDREAAAILQGNLVLAEYARHEGNDEESLLYLEQAADLQAAVIATSSTNFVAGLDRRAMDRLFRFLLDPPLNFDPRVKARAVQLAFKFIEQDRYRSIRNFILQTREAGQSKANRGGEDTQSLAKLDALTRQLAQRSEMSNPGLLRSAYSAYEDLVLKRQLDRSRYEIVRAARPVKLRDLQRDLDPATALVEYVLAGDKVFALVVRHERVAGILLPEGKAQLLERANLFQSLVFSPDVDTADQRWRPAARKLHQALIAPLEESGALDQAQRLAVIPYGFLHEVPFPALLRQSGNDRFLIEDYALFRVPSATFLHQQIASSRGSLGRKPLMLALGRNETRLDGEPPLEFATDEVKTIAGAGEIVRLTEADASETRFKQLAWHATHIHLATHGVFEPDMPLLSRILLEPTAEDDGDLTAREIFDLHLTADLVTLSACETGRSFSSSGIAATEIDRVGLIEAFLHAGSHSVLATLFPVSDRPTLEFMKMFYERLRHRDKANALAETQRAFLSGEASLSSAGTSYRDTSHPRYWAPFILVGNAR
ncbi:MAG TPA: CHAT domain-containing tetratricopeptide repeat protein [Pyrinomonadaceae bacterium]|nr:CHAT domain-containing tetratricopeptide repeat protein [Pyrinomonadaceae bacterium]